MKAYHWNYEQSLSGFPGIIISFHNSLEQARQAVQEIGADVAADPEVFKAILTKPFLIKEITQEILEVNAESGVDLELGDVMILDPMLGGNA